MGNFILGFIVAWFIATGGCSRAEASEVILSTYSYHFFQRDTNNENWGLHYVANNGFTAGVYNNSTAEPGGWKSSFHAGYGFPIYRPTWLRAPVTMTVGAVTGYSERNKLGYYFSFSYRQKLSQNWGAHYTLGALQVVNLGVGYRFGEDAK